MTMTATETETPIAPTLAPSAIGALRGELLAIAERLEEAESEMHSAQVYQRHGERAAAQAERDSALADYRAAREALADLGLLSLRHASELRRDALRVYLVDLLRPEMDTLADAIVALERSPR